MEKKKKYIHIVKRWGRFRFSYFKLNDKKTIRFEYTTGWSKETGEEPNVQKS